jgi:hypothetical protein
LRARRPQSKKQPSQRSGADARLDPQQGAPQGRPGERQVHDLGGSLAAAGLHLGVALTTIASPRGKAHVQAALRALRLSHQQLAELGQILSDDRDHPRRARARSR